MWRCDSYAQSYSWVKRRSILVTIGNSFTKSFVFMLSLTCSVLPFSRGPEGCRNWKMQERYIRYKGPDMDSTKEICRLQPDEVSTIFILDIRSFYRFHLFIQVYILCVTQSFASFTKVYLSVWLTNTRSSPSSE